MENLLNIRQVAFILKVHPLTVRRYIKEGKLKAVRIGGAVRVKESQVLDFNKEFVPRETKPQAIRSKIIPAKTFSTDDPFTRLGGRGASLNFSS